jgi:hypothetical protein
MVEEKKNEINVPIQIPDEQIEMSRKLVGIILLSLTDISAEEFKNKAKEVAQQIILKWYKV